MQSKGISAYGIYIPSLRMSRKAIAQAHAWAMPSLRGLGKGTRSFCSWDEDAVTMAVESIRACLKSNPAGGTVSSLTFASTSAPFADLQSASTVASATGLPDDLRVMDTGGSLRAATSSLITALEDRSTETSLIVASDCRKAKPGSVQEMQYGAGSAALAVGSDNIIADCIGSHSVAKQFIDHFRPATEKYDYYWEERWVRDEGYMKIVPQAVNALLKKTGISADAINHFCMPGNISKIGASLAKTLGIKPEAVVDNLAADVGDTGTPQPFLMFVKALEAAKPGDKILLVGFGAGCDAILFEATDAITGFKAATPLSAALQVESPVEHYNQLLAFTGELELDWGMRAETDIKVALTQLYRAQDQITGFNGGACPDCGTIQFPVLSTCVRCGSTASMKPHPLADEPAKIATYTSDYLMYYPAPPMYWGLVQFDNGARLLMEIVNVKPDKVDIGTPLKMVYRVKQQDNKRHLHRYFWKATPAN